MSRALLALAAVLALLPSATACSIAAQEFESATFAGDDLWYVDGASSLRRQHGALDIEVEDAFFLSFAVLPDEGLLIAGQDGLGADCGGLGWLELRRQGEVVWRRESTKDDDPFSSAFATRVIAHPLGPFVQLDGRFWRLDGEELVEVGRPTRDTGLLGFAADGRPVESAGNAVAIGGDALPLAPTGYAVAMASGDGVTAIVERIDWKVTVVHFVAGDQVRNVTWTPPEGWEPTAAWSDVLVVSSGSRAYRVTDEVVDLGVADVIAVAARDRQTAVFTADGYIVFDGTRPVERWTLKDGAWTPGAVPTATSTPVDSLSNPPHGLAEGAWDGDAVDEDGYRIPSVGLVMVAAAVALALLAGRWRRDG